MEKKIKKERRLITAALPYINNVPHLGHLVGSHLPADIFARYCRLKEYEVLFVGGTDENGSTTEISALKVGLDIETFSKKLHEEHKKVYSWFNISYDNFSRTTSKTHYDLVQEFFKEIYKNGYIKEGKINVFYSKEENRFLPDRYVKGVCKKCGYEDASGDQCEKCTSVLDAFELGNPRSVISGGKVEIKEVNHLFLDLDKLSNELKSWLETRKGWRSQVTNLALGWIKEGLNPRCITRDLKHGVPVPLKGFEDKVFYVWFDAPIGYVSFTKEFSNRWKTFWKGKIYNFLGKDNIPFHTIFWPGMILAHKEFSLPEKVVGLQYLNYEGGKFSKSKKRGVFCERVCDSGVPVDIWRAYLTQLIPETSDTEFKWKEFQERINSDLIGNFGNFVNRVLTFSKSKFEGVLKRPRKFSVEEKSFLIEIEKDLIEVEKLFEDCEIRKAYSKVLEISSKGNKFLDYSAPWKSVKEDEEKARASIYICLEIIKKLSILFSPFIPSSALLVQEQLELSNLLWKDLFLEEKEYKIGEVKRLFSNLDDEIIENAKKITCDAPNLEEFFGK